MSSNHKIEDYDKIDYAHFWSSPKRTYIDELEKYLIDKVTHPSNEKLVVDLGGGFGRLSKIYLHKYQKVILLDYSEKLLHQAQGRLRNNSNLAFIRANVYKLPFRDNSVDSIFMVRLFHHLEQPVQVFQEIKRVLKDEGEIFFSFYNKYDLRNRCKVFFGLPKSSTSRISHENVSRKEFLYLSSPAYVEELLDKFNFDILGRYGVGLFIGRLLKFRRVFRPIDKFLYKLSGKFNLTTEILIHAKNRLPLN